MKESDPIAHPRSRKLAPKIAYTAFPVELISAITSWSLL